MDFNPNFEATIMSKKQLPILYRNLLYKRGNYFLDRR